MIVKNLIFCLQETASQFIAKEPDNCLLNPPCGCSNPGKELHCESCSYLEACLSRCHMPKLARRKLKP